MISATGLAIDIFDNSSVASLGIGKCLYPYNITGAFTSPAALMCVDRSQILGSYYLLFSGARYNLLGYGYRGEKFVFSGHVLQLYRDGIEVRTSFTETPDQLTYLSKIGGLFSFASLLDTLIIKDIMLGGSLKFLYYDIHNTQSNVGFGVDLGAYKKGWYTIGSTLNNRFSINAGISVLNVLSPSVQMGSAVETYPVNVIIPLAFNLTVFPRYDLKREQLIYDEISVFLDLFTSPAFNFGLGLQYNYIDMLKFRVGYSQGNITTGFGLEFENITINYAFSLKDYGQLHFLDVVYAFGERQVQKAEELEDYLTTQRKAERIYDKTCRQAEELIGKKEYEYAGKILQRAIPLKPQDEKATQLLSLCEKAALTEKMSNLYKKCSEDTDSVSVYKKILTAINLDPIHQIPRTMLENFRTKEIPERQINEISGAKKEFIAKENGEISSALKNNEFEKANKECVKIILLEPESENTVRQKTEIDNAKKDFVEQLVRKAVEFQGVRNYRDAYLYMREAYKVSEDVGILAQTQAYKEAYLKENKPGLVKDLYQKKLYYLTAISFVEDKSAKETRENFYQLKANNAAFEYFDFLENALLKAGIIERILP